MREIVGVIFILIVSLWLPSPAHCANEDSDQEKVDNPPELIKENCTYLGAGLGSSGTKIKENGYYSNLYWVDLSYQCRKAYNSNNINPEGYLANNDNQQFSKLLEDHAKKIVYKNMSRNGDGGCEVQHSGGDVVNLTSKPGHPKYWEYASDSFFLHYSATFLCKTPKHKKN